VFSLEAPVRWHVEVKFEKDLPGKVIIILVIRTDIRVNARVVVRIVWIVILVLGLGFMRGRDVVCHSGILGRVDAERRISSMSVLEHDHKTRGLVLLALCTRRKTILPWLCLQRNKREDERGKQTQRGSQIPITQRKLLAKKRRRGHRYVLYLAEQ
jgi:hypothetical protein